MDIFLFQQPIKSQNAFSFVTYSEQSDWIFIIPAPNAFLMQACYILFENESGTWM